MNQDKNVRNDAANEDLMNQTPLGAGFTTNVGFSNPGSPSDAMGIDPLPNSGGVGALDPGAGGDVAGDDQAHDRGIVSDNALADGVDMTRQASDEAEQRNIGGSSTSW